MLDEVDGPMNFTQMVTLFATKMAGGSDDDDVILASFEAFEQDGKIDAETFRAQLMTFGNKFSASDEASPSESTDDRKQSQQSIDMSNNFLKTRKSFQASSRINDKIVRLKSLMGKKEQK